MTKQSFDIPHARSYRNTKRVVAMAGLSLFRTPRQVGNVLGAAILALALAACGQGDGPEGITNSPATPLPDIPTGFCDPINFETLCDTPEIINFNGGATVVVDNPAPSAVNDTERVARMQKFPDQVFGGTRINPLETPVDFSAGEAYTIKVWSERSVPMTFKLEETTDGTLGVERVATHGGGSVWEELCFDFTGSTVNTIGLTIIFDNGVLGAAIEGVFSGDWTFYYDEITQVESCTGGGSSAIDPDSALFSTSGNPDLVIPDDYAEITPFDSGSVIDQFFADDTTFSPVISVFSGTTTGANLAQIGFIGFQAGFLGAYQSVDFKVKGMPNQVVFVNLYDGVDSLRLNLTSSAYSTDLGDGWFQVSIPVADFSGVGTATGISFESDTSATMQFRMLLTDVGFSGTGSNPPPPPPPPFDSGLLTNGDFEAGPSPWLAGVTNPIDAANVIDDGGNNVYFVDVTAAGNPFDVNLSQQLAITPDETYTLTFRARSNVMRSIVAGIGLSGGSFANTVQTVNLTTAWQDFTLELTATGFGDATSRVLFDLGAEIGEVYIDEVSLVVSTTPPFDSGLLTNGDFEAGPSPWLAGVTNPIDAANVIDDGGNNVYFVNVMAAGNPFDVNLSQQLAITPDETYTLTFRARSNVMRSIVAGIGLSGGSFANTVQTVNLTTAWQDFTLELTATGFGDATSRVLFDLGAEIGEVYIDDVSLVVSTTPPPPPFDPGLLTNGDFESGTSPWLAGVTNPIDAANVIDDGGNNVYFVDVTAAGNPFDVNLSQQLAITPDETYTLTFMARSNVMRSIVAGIGLSGGSFANTVQTVNLTTAWQEFTLELTATGFGDATSRVLFDLGAEIGEVYIDDVSLVVSTGGGGGGGGGGGTGDLAVNGDFETGDFTGWQQFINSGLQSISTDMPAGGMFSGAISGNTAPGAGGTTEIKQANLGAGTLAVGDVLTITFDVRGTFGPGGQLNVLSFTEFGGGGADLSDQTVIAGGVDNWTTQSYNVTLSGSDAGGGFSLAFNAVCGAVTDCVADVFIDNVSIVTN